MSTGSPVGGDRDLDAEKPGRKPISGNPRNKINTGLFIRKPRLTVTPHASPDTPVKEGRHHSLGSTVFNSFAA